MTVLRHHRDWHVIEVPLPMRVRFWKSLPSVSTFKFSEFSLCIPLLLTTRSLLFEHIILYTSLPVFFIA